MPEKSAINIHPKSVAINSDFITANQLLTSPEYQHISADEFFNILIFNLQDFSKDILYRKKNGDTWEDVPKSQYINKISYSLESKIFPKDDDGHSEVKKQKKSKTQLEYSKIKNKEETPTSLKTLKTFSIIVLLFFLIYGVVQYQILTTKLQVYSSNFKLINISFKALYNFHICTYSIRNLILLKNPNFNNLNDFNRTYFISQNLDNIHKYQQELTSINQQLSNSSITLLPEHKDLFLNPNVPLLIFRGPNNMVTTSTFNLLYAFDVQISFIMNLLPGLMQDMVEDNPIIMEFFYNNFNSFIDKLYLSTNYYLKV